SFKADRRRASARGATIHHFRRGLNGLWRQGDAVRPENMDRRISAWSGRPESRKAQTQDRDLEQDHPRGRTNSGQRNSIAGEIGLVTKGFNPVRDAASRHKTQKRERFLSVEEMKRLADALTQVEQFGLAWRLNPNLDEARVKHRAKPDRQRIEVSPFVIAAIR